MDAHARLQGFDRDADRFADAAASAGLTAPAPSCPGWSVGDLVWHVTEVHNAWAGLVESRAEQWIDVATPARPADGELLEVHRATRHRLRDVLGGVDPSTAVWTWSNDHSVEFVIRRMAQEMAVHRWDAESARGEPSPIDPELASDGIDEFLTHFLPNVDPAAAAVGGSVHIHCGDVAGEWTIRPNAAGDEPWSVTREHAKGDCALRGDASSLLLALWRRLPLGAVDVVGDAEVAARFVASTDLS